VADQTTSFNKVTVSYSRWYYW